MAFFSLERRIAFIHVPKTGGTAIIKALGSIPDAVSLMPHARARDVRDIISPETYATMTTIAVVREPLSWIGSYWRYMRQDENHPLYMTMRDVSFASLMRRVAQLAPIGWRQADYLTDESGRRIVTHVLRFESLEYEWSELARQLQIDPALDRVNESRQELGDAASCEPAGRAVLERVLSDDFLRLGYAPSDAGRLVEERQRLAARVTRWVGAGWIARVRLARAMLEFGELDVAAWMLRTLLSCEFGALKRAAVQLRIVPDPRELERRIPSGWWPAKPTHDDIERFVRTVKAEWSMLPQRIVE